MEILNELVEFWLVTSIIYIIYVLFNFSIKIYGRFKLNNDTKFNLNKIEKIMLLISLSTIFSKIF